MSLYLLDTNVLIDLSGPRHSRGFFERILGESSTRLSTSMLCIAEYAAGAGPGEEAFLKGLIDGGELDVFPIDSIEDALRAGHLRKKDSLGLPDALILMTALRHHAHLLTHDGEFLKKARTIVPTSDPIVC